MVVVPGRVQSQQQGLRRDLEGQGRVYDTGAARLDVMPGQPGVVADDGDAEFPGRGLGDLVLVPTRSGESNLTNHGRMVASMTDTTELYVAERCGETVGRVRPLPPAVAADGVQVGKTA